MGSAGQSQGGGSRVYPGKKMAGRMGGQRVTVQNVEILSTDEEKGIVVLRGMYMNTIVGAGPYLTNFSQAALLAPTKES